MPLEYDITVQSLTNSTSFANAMDDRHYEKKYEQMRQQHELDKKVLMAQFHYQNNSLQQQHQLQLQEHLQMVISKQREHRELMAQHQPDDLMNVIKHKDKKNESAVASNAVKKHLQNFVIGRQKVKMDPNHSGERPGSLRWNPLVDEIEDSREQSPIFHSPYYNKGGDFPLRKTASEPNLKVRSRLKQKLSLDQRSSPLLTRRHDIKLDIANRIKKKLNSESVAEAKNDSLSNSSPSSPPTVNNDASTSAHHSSESNGRNPQKPAGNARDLYTSPSLPNLSIGKKPSDQVIFAPHEAEFSRLMARTASFPDPLINLSKKDYLPQMQDHPKEIKLEPGLVAENLSLLNQTHKPILYGKEPVASSHGPIRTSQLSRPHKTLIRTQSAPNSATSQLQQHILQRKHNKCLKQQQQQEKKLLMKYRDHPSLLSVHPESELEGKDVYSRLRENLSLGIYSSMEKAEATFDEKLTLHRNTSQPMAVEPSLPATAASGDSAMAVDLQQRINSTFKPNTAPHTPRTVQPFLHRPLQRTQSSPAFMKKLTICKKYRHTTGIAYSPVMLQHGCACGDDHVENAGRLRAIWERLTNCELVKKDTDNEEGLCELIEPRKATTDELQLVHSQEHTLRYGTTSLARKELDLCSKFIVLPCGGVGVDNGIDIDTVWNELPTINAARMAVGCTVDLSILVAQNRLRNGFALVRPPGHHAETNLAMAFCYFNAVAVAARKLQSLLLVRKILILDWDIHHCNGTQNIFYNDPSVLVISIHRYDDGNFFPGTGALDEVGADLGVGFNVNIGFSGGIDPVTSDAEYLAVFRSIVMPIALRFRPDIVLVSSGFSAASGHSSPLGGYAVSPQCFGYLTHWLSQLANGRVVMALEGGFELGPLCDCTEICVRTLLGVNESSKLSDVALTAKPHPKAVETVDRVVAIQGRHWKGLDRNLARISHAEWISVSRDNETVNAMASLSVKSQNNIARQPVNSRHDEKSPKRHHAMPGADDSGRPNKTSNNLEKSPADVSVSDESSPLDVVGTTPPSSPNGDEKPWRERLITSDGDST